VPYGPRRCRTCRTMFTPPRSGSYRQRGVHNHLDTCPKCRQEAPPEKPITPEPGGLHTVRVGDRGDGWKVFGFTADNHLGSKHERLDVLNALYDLFAAEGVTAVFNGGNWIEGQSRFNQHDIKVYGLESQLRYFIDNYPQRPGITTYYVAGDDHEGWWQQREQINIGETLEAKAIRAGRTDLRYLGYVEADVQLRAKAGSTAMRVMHGGGGAAYAYSYVLQKQVESFQGGEKPAILMMGHHHKFDYCYPRNVHAFMPGCTEDQSIFMRKKKIEAHVGGVIGWLKQGDDGAVERFRAEWLPFYNRGFYERRYEV
jgi:predicted phosphodiesterase